MKIFTAYSQIVETMFEQLSGNFNKLSAMIGVSKWSHTDNSITVMFKAKAIHGIRAFKLQYDNSSDTYTLTFLKSDFKVVKVLPNLYGDQLKDVFEYNTGLKLSL